MACPSLESKDEGAWAQKATSWSLALSRMQDALRLLDEAAAPPHIGAQLDFAIQRLSEEIAQLENG